MLNPDRPTVNAAIRAAFDAIRLYRFDDGWAAGAHPAPLAYGRARLAASAARVRHALLTLGYRTADVYAHARNTRGEVRRRVWAFVRAHR